MRLILLPLLLAACSGASSDVFDEQSSAETSAEATGSGVGTTVTGATSTSTSVAAGGGGPGSSGSGAGDPATTGTDSSTTTGAGGHVELPACDDGLALDDPDPEDAARSIGICEVANVDGHGVVQARWVDANGAAVAATTQVGIMDRFGTNVPPFEGERLLVLSSGSARTAGQPDFCGTESCSLCDPGDFVCTGGHPAPPGFPQEVPGCELGTNIADDAGLELVLRAPANATGYSFRYRFYSWEFPEWVCTQFNDQFIALVEPPPPGAINGNISFDDAEKPVSVNIDFGACATCEPWAASCTSGCPPPPNPCCPDGPGALAGTGFDGGRSGAGATSWLETRAPVQGGQEISIRFAIFDTGDTALDSTVVIDDFRWITGGAVEVGTERVPD